MSKYRCEVDIAFDTEEMAVSFLNLLSDIQGKLFTGTGSEEIPIISKCRYHKCFHDETPPKPCGGYVTYDLKQPMPKVKTSEGVEIDSLKIVQEKVDLVKATLEAAKPKGE